MPEPVEGRGAETHRLLVDLEVSSYGGGRMEAAVPIDDSCVPFF